MALTPRLDDLLELRHQAHALGLASHHLVNSSFAGLYASVFRGAGLNFEEAREYREGDDIRHMDWKLTARTDRPHLKLFREERERCVMLCVEHGPRMAFGTRGTFKSVAAARAAALLGWAASRLNDRVGGLTFGSSTKSARHFHPARGRRALWQLLRTLTLPAPPASAGHGYGADPGPLNRALEQAARGLPSGSLVFAIADLNLDARALERAFGNLAQRHTLALLPVDDPADWQIPAMGPIRFVGPDGTGIEIDTDDPVGRRRFAARWQEQRAALAALAARLRLPLLPIRTDRDIHLDLAYGLRARARSRAV